MEFLDEGKGEVPAAEGRFPGGAAGFQEMAEFFLVVGDMDQGGRWETAATGWACDRDPSFAKRYGGQAGHATVGGMVPFERKRFFWKNVGWCSVGKAVGCEGLRGI